MIGKREIRRSLRTRSKREEIVKASPLVVNARRIIKAAYAGTRPDLRTLTTESISAITDLPVVVDSIIDLMEAPSRQGPIPTSQEGSSKVVPGRQALGVEGRH